MASACPDRLQHYICVHPDDKDRDGQNNVLYLAQLVDAYRQKALNLPFVIPHFGLRFPSFESIEPVLDRLENCSDPEMKPRVKVKVVRPTDGVAMSSDLIQAFIYTDIVASGLFCLGQVIELQAQRASH